MNGKLESSHRFIKDCVRKFPIDSVLYAIAAFNWFPNEHSQESPHILFFGCDPYLPHLAVVLQLKLGFLGSDQGMIHLNKLSQAYMLAALNMKESHSSKLNRSMMMYPIMK